MTARVRPYMFYDVALTICSTCFRKLEGKIVFQDDKVFLLKRCPEHGAERVLVADDVDYYRRCREVFLKRPEMPQVYNTPVKWGCPYDCGLCTDHEQHSCLTLVELTDSCNLRCPVCYAGSGPERTEHRSLALIEKMLDAVVGNEGKPDVVQLSGGEPTLHPDFFKILKLAQARPIRHLMVNTNGLRIAQDEEFVRRLAEYPSGLEIYLQFDSFEREALLDLRGGDLRGVRRRALENLNKYEISTTLVVTLKKGLNDGEIGKVIDFALTQPCVRGVTPSSPSRTPAASKISTLPPIGSPLPKIRRKNSRTNQCVSSRRRDSRSLPSRFPGHGLRAENRRQGCSIDRNHEDASPHQRRPQHHRL